MVRYRSVRRNALQDYSISNRIHKRSFVFSILNKYAVSTSSHLQRTGCAVAHNAQKNMPRFLNKMLLHSKQKMKHAPPTYWLFSVTQRS